MVCAMHTHTQREREREIVREMERVSERSTNARTHPPTHPPTHLPQTGFSPVQRSRLRPPVRESTATARDRVGHAVVGPCCKQGVSRCKTPRRQTRGSSRGCIMVAQVCECFAGLFGFYIRSLLPYTEASFTLTHTSNQHGAQVCLAHA